METEGRIEKRNHWLNVVVGSELAEQWIVLRREWWVMETVNWDWNEREVKWVTKIKVVGLKYNSIIVFQSF